LIDLARRLGLAQLPSPSTGCALTEPAVAAKVHDLVRLAPHSGRWDFELVKIGRHIRYNASTKIVLGRREEENAALVELYRRDDSAAAALLMPHNFNGPVALVTGSFAGRGVPDACPLPDALLRFAVGLVVRYSKRESVEPALVRIDWAAGSTTVPAIDDAAAMAAQPL
jgi:hypothetical protein